MSLSNEAGSEHEEKYAFAQGFKPNSMEIINNSDIYRHWLPLFTVFLGTGCRVGEIIGLRWQDLDFESRTIPMLDEARRALLQEKQQQMQKGYNENNGRVFQYKPKTVAKWYQLYEKGGMGPAREKCLTKNTISVTEFYREFCTLLGLEASGNKTGMFRAI